MVQKPEGGRHATPGVVGWRAACLRLVPGGFPVYLFDVDGTLVDSAPDICAAVQSVLHSRGRFDVPDAVLRTAHLYRQASQRDLGAIWDFLSRNGPRCLRNIVRSIPARCSLNLTRPIRWRTRRPRRTEWRPQEHRDDQGHSDDAHCPRDVRDAHALRSCPRHRRISREALIPT